MIAYFTILDWIMVVLLIVGVVQGCRRGAVRQVLGLLGVVGGIILACRKYEEARCFLVEQFSWNERTATIVGFAAILLLVMVAAGLVGYLVSKIIDNAFLGPLDRVLGGLLGIVKILILLGTVFEILSMTGLERAVFYNQTGKQTTVLYEPIRSVTQQGFQWIREKGDGLMDELPEIKSNGGDSKRRENRRPEFNGNGENPRMRNNTRPGFNGHNADSTKRERRRPDMNNNDNNPQMRRNRRPDSSKEPGESVETKVI